MTRPVSEIDYPKDLGEWWLLCEHHKDELRGLASRYHPSSYRAHDFSISAPKAEAACELVREGVRSRGLPKCAGEMFDQYLTDHSPNMPDLLSEVWFGLPESHQSRGLLGFGVLCDLCSESWVFWEEQQENQRED